MKEGAVVYHCYNRYTGCLHNVNTVENIVDTALFMHYNCVKLSRMSLPLHAFCREEIRSGYRPKEGEYRKRKRGTRKRMGT